jgi:hypothetical protein
MKSSTTRSHHYLDIKLHSALLMCQAANTLCPSAVPQVLGSVASPLSQDAEAHSLLGVPLRLGGIGW